MKLQNLLDKACHPPGRTLVACDKSSGNALTAGADGRIKVWDDLIDDEALLSIKTGSNDYTDMVITATEIFCNGENPNTVISHNIEDGSHNSLTTRFSSTVNSLSSNGVQVAACSNDFGIKVVNENKDIISLNGHEGPVLSIELSSYGSGYLASASGDETVKIWKIKTKCCLHDLKILPKCADASLSTSREVMSWSKDDCNISIPINTEVHVYSRESGERVKKFSDKSIDKPIQICKYSPDNEYIACGTGCGKVIIWNTETEKCCNMSVDGEVTSLCWNSEREILVATNKGLVNSIKVVTDEANTQPSQKSENLNTSKIADVFDGSDLDNLSDIDEGDIVDQVEQEIKQEVGERKSKKIESDSETETEVNKPADDLVSESGTSAVTTDTTVKPKIDLTKVKLHDEPVLSEYTQQETFQNGSTPLESNSTCRFMVWNSVAAIRSYSDTNDSTIDIEFHDSTVHHNIHINNMNAQFNLADICETAVVLARTESEKGKSSIRVIDFGANSDNAEWNITLDKSETPECVCISEEFVAVATSTGLIRCFTVGGLQLAPFMLPGAVVTMSAYKSYLLISYHRAPASEDQHISVTLMKISDNKKQVLLKSDPLPLSAGSTLQWLGFTMEGTPASYDSGGYLNFFGVDGPIWTPMLSTKKSTKDSTCTFIIKITERPAHVYCITCKNNTYPRVSPRPSLALLELNIPVCMSNKDVNQLEELVVRNRLLKSATNNWLSEELTQTSDYEREEQTSLLKLFSIAMRDGRVERSYQICKLMTSHYIELAVQYCVKTHNNLLARRISKLSGCKNEEEEVIGVYDDFTSSVAPNARAHTGETAVLSEDEDVYGKLASKSYQTPTRVSLKTSNSNHSQTSQNISTPDNSDDSRVTFKGVLSQDVSPLIESESLDITPSYTSKPNPFKRSAQKAGMKSITDLHSSITESNKKPIETKEKPVHKVKQTKLFVKAAAPVHNENKELDSTEQTSRVVVNKTEDEGKTEDVENIPQTPKRSAFDIYFEENFSTLEDHSAARKEALEKFKTLTRDEKKVYLEKSKNQPKNVKRKHAEEDLTDQSEPENKKPTTLTPSSNTLNKLVAFSAK